MVISAIFLPCDYIAISFNVITPPMIKLLLLLATAFALPAAAQITPQDSPNSDATHNPGANSGFLTDTNRSFPILFIVGDSTVHNLSRGERGWGDIVGKYFDTNKIHVENHALGGRSSRTFITQGWWDKVLTNSKPGDYVLIQMGHNDGGALDDTNRARGSIRGLGDDTRDIFNPITKKPETVHTYGWYLRKYIDDAHAKGMTAILCTPIPHCPTNEVHAGDVEKNDFVRLSTAVAENEKVPLINLNQIVMSHYAGMAPREIKEKYFTPADNTHTSLAGAELNAQSVIEGLRKLDSLPLNHALLPQPGG